MNLWVEVARPDNLSLILGQTWREQTPDRHIHTQRE